MRELNNSDCTLHVEANLKGRDEEVPEEANPTEYQTYLDSKPDSIEVEAVKTVIAAMHNSSSDVKVHINNVASGAACEVIKVGTSFKRHGLDVKKDANDKHSAAGKREMKKNSQGFWMVRQEWP